MPAPRYARGAGIGSATVGLHRRQKLKNKRSKRDQREHDRLKPHFHSPPFRNGGHVDHSGRLVDPCCERVLGMLQEY